MYTTNYQSLEKEIHLTEKQKLAKEYFSMQADFYIASLVVTKGHIETARNYYASVRDELDFEYLEDIYGMQNPIDLGFTNIIKPRVDAIVGLSLLSEPDFRVAYTDTETIQAVEEEKLDGILKEIQSELTKSIGQAKRDEAQAPNGKAPAPTEAPTEGTKDWLKGLTSKYGKNYISSYQIAAQHIIKLIETDADIDLSNIKKELSKNYFTTGEAYTKEIYVGDGKDPKKMSVLPEEIFTNRARGQRDLKQTDVVVHRRRVTPHQILKELGHLITKEEAEKLYSAYSSLSGDMVLLNGAPDVMIPIEPGMQMDTMYMKTGWSDIAGGLTGDLTDLYHIEWLASTRIPNGKGSHVYREDRYECYRVGADIHIGGRKCDEAPRTQDTIWKTTLSYKGLINTSPSGKIESMVNNLREIQDLYDIMMFFRNNTVANSGVSGSRVNVAAIPKALGKKFMDRLTKWVTLRKQGLELIDPTEEGANLFQHYGDFDASISANSVQAINAILESLTVQADIVSGVPRQMLGVIEQRDAVENVKVGINQVSVLSLEMFRDIDRCLNSGVQETLDNFKYAYRETPKQGIYRNGLVLVPFIVSPTKFSLTDYRVTVVSSGIENAKLLKIQNLATEFVKAQAMSPETLVKIMNKKSIHEIEHIMQEDMAKRKEEAMSIQKMQQQLDGAAKQIQQLEAEIARLENNAVASNKERLEVEKLAIKTQETLKNRELDIEKERDENDKKIQDKEIILKTAVVDLEKEQVIYGSGSAREVKNKF